MHARACSTHFHRRKRTLTGRPGKVIFLPRLYSKRRKCCRPPSRRRPRRPLRYVSPSDTFSTHPPSHFSRPDQRHDTRVTHIGRADYRMAVHTRDNCAIFARGGLRRLVRRNGDPHGRPDDGARRER